MAKTNAIIMPLCPPSAPPISRNSALSPPRSTAVLIPVHVPIVAIGVRYSHQHSAGHSRPVAQHEGASAADACELEFLVTVSDRGALMARHGLRPRRQPRRPVPRRRRHQPPAPRPPAAPAPPAATGGAPGSAATPPAGTCGAGANHAGHRTVGGRATGPSPPGVPLYPTAEYLDTFDAGAASSTSLRHERAVRRDRVVLQDDAQDRRARSCSARQPTHQFDLGRFQEERMAFPPSVVVKDYTWNNSPGYLYVVGHEREAIQDDHPDRATGRARSRRTSPRPSRALVAGIRRPCRQVPPRRPLDRRRPCSARVVANLLRDLHAAELRPAHRTEVRHLRAVGRQRLVVVRARGDRIERQVELIFPSELEPRLRQRVVPHLRARDGPWPGRPRARRSCRR